MRTDASPVCDKGLRAALVHSSVKTASNAAAMASRELAVDRSLLLQTRSQ